VAVFSDSDDVEVMVWIVASVATESDDGLDIRLGFSGKTGLNVAEDGGVICREDRFARKSM
jgi:hypothetical protein